MINKPLGKQVLPLATVILLGCLVVMAIGTRSWPLISDAVLIRYANLMLRDGVVPYRQLVDINTPGSYLVDALATKVFGTSAAGWRAFDLALMVFSISAMAWVARRSSILTGICAGALFALFHAADGVAQLGQRDLVVAVILLCGFVVLNLSSSLALRVRLLLFGLCCGVAATIKPTALLFILIASPLLLAERQRAKAAAESTLLLLAATVLPWIMFALWLLQKGALQAFLDTAGGLMKYHAGMARQTSSFLLVHAIPPLMLPLSIPSLVLLFLRKDWQCREQQIVLIGIACGFASFFLQGKAYPYHRYPLLVYLLLLVTLEIGPTLASKANERPRLEAALAFSVIVYGALWLGPASVAKALRYDWRFQPALSQLQADLTAIALTLPDSGLNNTVQCLDTMAGCITVLDRMQVFQSTGFLYDCYLFAPGGSAVEQDQRRRFAAQLAKAPPRIFVVTDQWCLNLPSGYDKLHQWPEFDTYLNSHYVLTLERSWRVAEKRKLATWPFGYRIYTLRSM